MSRWTAVAFAGMWMGIGIASFNVDPGTIKSLALYGSVVTGVLGFFEIIS